MFRLVDLFIVKLFLVLYKFHIVKSKKLDSAINQVKFSPNGDKVAIAIDTGLLFWDLTTDVIPGKLTVIEESQYTEIQMYNIPASVKFNCVDWSTDGAFIYAGCSDNLIRIFEVI